MNTFKKALVSKLMLLLMLFTGTSAVAQTTATGDITTNDVVMNLGETATVEVKLTSSEAVINPQFDITLPEGVEIVAGSMKRGDLLSRQHTPDYAKQATGNTYRFLVTSLNVALNATEGTLLTFDVKSTKVVAGNIEVTGKEMILDADHSVVLNPKDSKSSIRVNVAFDGTVAVSVSTTEATPEYDTPFSVDFDMENTGAVVNVQATLTLPEGVKLVETVDGNLGYTDRIPGNVSINAVPNPNVPNQYTIIMTNLSATPIIGNGGTLFTINMVADENLPLKSAVKITGIVVATQNGGGKHLEDEFTITLNNNHLGELLAELEAAVADAEAIDLTPYSEESAQALTDAIAAGKELLTSDAASKVSLTAAIAAIAAAKEGLEESTGTKGSATYAMAEGETHKAGDTVEVKNEEGDVVATLTFGFEGGADFTAPKKDDKRIEGFWGYTEGNGQNGKPAEGTVYIINPKYDGQIEVAVVLNNGKKFYIQEDGVSLPDYDAITVETKYQGTYKFNVKAGSEYKVYCEGSKLGFYGFNYTYTIPGDEPQYETVGLTKEMYHEWDSFEADANIVGDAYMEYNVGNELAPGNTVYGDGAVNGKNYADLTGAVKLVFEGTPGVVARALFNRQDMGGTSTEYVEKNSTIGEDGTAEMDLTDLPYVHLNVVKLGWGSAAGTITAINIVKPAEGGNEPEEPGLTLPLIEDFEGETTIFEGGEVFDAGALTHVLKIRATTATADLGGYTIAEDEKVTIQFTAFQGWVSGGTLVAAVKDSEGNDLVSYTYDCGPCNVTDVAIGGKTVEGFEAFFGQSRTYASNASNRGSANNFGHASQPFLSDEGYNPLVTMSITGAGLVEFNFQYTKVGDEEINVTYTSTLPEGTTIDLGSLVLTTTGNADAFGIDNLSITSATAGEEETPTVAWVYTAGYGSYSYAFETDPIVQALQEVYNVVEVSIAASINPTEDEELNSTLLNADVVVVCEAMAGNNPMSNSLVKYVGQVPVIALKAFNYNNGRWNWGTPGNPSPAALSFTTNATYKVLEGVTYEEDGVSIKVATETGTAPNAVQYVNFGDGAPADMVIMGSIAEGAAMYASNAQKFFGLGLSSDCWNYYTENAGIIVKNAVAMLVAGEDLTANDGPITGITTVDSQTENGAIYNLQGQKVLKAQKGLYIINGKKVLVK